MNSYERVMNRFEGKEVPVMGWIEGAFAESCDLMRMQDLFVSFFDEPEAIKELLEKCTEEEILFAKAQIDAGVDITGIDYMVDMEKAA